MTPQEHRLIVQSIAQADHKILADAIENFKKLFTGYPPLYAAKQFDDIRRIMAEKLAQHFAHEEDDLFPALLAGNPNPRAVQSIAELRMEHPSLLEEARLLSVLLRGSSPTGLSAELRAATLRFLSRLEKHAAKEDQLFTSETSSVGPSGD